MDDPLTETLKQGNGDAACPIHCSPVDVMGLFELGACGQCLADEDCMGSCQLGELDLGSGVLSGSVCI